jgi:hypothetical protein
MTVVVKTLTFPTRLLPPDHRKRERKKVRRNVFSILFLFICSLFNDTVIKPDSKPIASNEWMATKSELERVRQEVVVAYFKILSRYLPEGTE